RWNDNPSQTAEFRAEKIKTALLRNMEWFDNHLPVSKFASLATPTTSATNRSVKVFNLQGICIGTYASEAEATSNQEKGIYIINGRKLKIE
ncbi:MAG: hypothetical protein K2G79_07340, partial [Muribaculum sp.]|nr:hypothetical protein [Muribaculum sp.]